MKRWTLKYYIGIVDKKFSSGKGYDESDIRFCRIKAAVSENYI